MSKVKTIPFISSTQKAFCALVSFALIHVTVILLGVGGAIGSCVP